MLSLRRISLLLLAAVFLALVALLHFQQKQENRDHLTRHNLRHLGTITQRITERLDAFATAVKNAMELRNAAHVRSTNDAPHALHPSPDAATRDESLSRIFSFPVIVTALRDTTGMSTGVRLSANRAGVVVVENGSAYLVSGAIADVLDIGAITEDAYDAVFITDAKNGAVLFNSGSAPIDVTRFDSISVEKGPRIFEAAAIRTTAGQVRLAGRPYECYVQPMGDRRVVAILDADRFEEKAQALPGSQIVHALVLLGLLLFAAPLVSLHFAGFTDRVTPLDMFLTIVGVAAGSALLTLLVASFVYLEFDSDVREDARLETLAETIRSRTVSEFDAVDRMISGLSELKLGDKETASRRLLFAHPDSARHIDTAFLHYPFFEQIYWIDSSGWLCARWTTLDQGHQWINLSDRAYFQNIMAGQRHWIQPHYSRGNSRFMVAYSTAESFPLRKKEKDSGGRSALVAVDFLPRALVDVTLPHGHGFAIITHEGDVLFHSIVQRSLHENLFAECNEKALRDMVEAGASGHISARYWDEDVRLYMRPMQLRDQHWYLVTYAGQSLHDDRKAGTLIMCLVLYLLFFLPVIAGYTVFLYLRDRRLAWMWYQSYRTRDYILLTMLILGAAGLCMVLSLSTDDLPSAMLIGCIVPHAALLTAFYRLDSHAYPGGQLSYLAHSRLGSSTQRRIVTIVHVAALVFYAAVILGNTRELPSSASASASSGFGGIILIATFIGGVATLFLLLTRRQRKRLASRRELLARHARMIRRLGKPGHDGIGRRWYIAFLTSLTLMLGVVPMFLFFRVAHDLHAIAFAHVEQTMIRHGVARHDGPAGNSFESQSAGTAEHRVSIKDMHLRDRRGFYFPPGASLDTLQPDQQYRIFNDFMLRVLMLPLTQGASSLRAHLRGEELQPPMSIGTSTVYYHAVPDFLEVFPDSFTAVPRLLLAVLLLLLLWQTVLFGARRLFLCDVVGHGWREDPESGGSGIYVWATRAERQEYLNRYGEVFDMARPEASTEEWVHASVAALLELDKQKHPIVLDHFDYRAENPSFTLRKLELLEHLLITHGCEVRLLCSVDPEYYLLDADHVAPPVEIQERWKRVLNMMRRLHLQSQVTADADASGAFIGDGLSAIVGGECALPGLHEHAERARMLIRDGEIRTREALFSWLAIACRPFYQALWMTCTKREQLVLYHLAQDGFISHRSRDVVEQLLQRGLVVMDPALRAFNESFRQFILTARTFEEIRRWEDEEPQSAWARVKHPMLGLVVIIAAVLLYTNPHYFDSTIAVLTALAAVIPLVMRLRGFVSGEKTSPQ